MRYFLGGMFGPFVTKEMIQLSRRPRTYVARILVGLAILFGLMLVWTPWHTGYNAPKVCTIAEIARFGHASVIAVGGVLWVTMIIFPFVFLHDTFAREHEQKTLDLLQLTDPSDWQIVWGKYLSTIAMGSFSLLVTLPVFISCQLLGGVDTTLIVVILFIAEVLLISSTNCAIFASVNYFHSRVDRFLIWLKSYFILSIVYFGICTFTGMFFGSAIVIPLISAVGLGLLFLHTYISVRESSDRLPIVESDYLKWKGFVKKRESKRQEIRLIDIEQRSIVNFAFAFPRSGLNFIWLIFGITLLAASTSGLPAGELPRMIFSRCTRIWVLLTPILCANLIREHRLGVWENLLIAPLSNKDLLLKYLRFGFAPFLSFWTPALAITLLVAPISSRLLIPQMLVLLSLAIWVAMTSWLANISNKSRRMAVWGPMALSFGMLIAVPMLGSADQLIPKFSIPFILSTESILAAFACIWTIKRPSSTAIVMCSIALLFLFTNLNGVLLHAPSSLTADPILLLDPFSEIPSLQIRDMSEVAMSTLGPIVAVMLTGFTLTLITLRNLDRITERVEQRNHHVR